VTTSVRAPYDAQVVPRPAAAARDAVSWLTVWLVVLYAVPSHLVIAQLGGAGSPSQILALVSALWWGWDRVHRAQAPPDGLRPVGAALGVLLAAVGASYVAAMLRPIASAESSTADLMLVAVLAWAGTTLLVADGVPTRARLEVLVNRAAVAGGVMALLGIVQFVAHRSFMELVTIPGLSENGSVVGAYARESFTRPSGTAVHPIEYGYVLTMLLPFAVHRARTAPHRALRRAWPAVAIGCVIPLSLSRSAILGAVMVLVVVVPTLSRASRWALVAGIGVGGGVMFVTVPGLLGSVTGLFTGIGGDTSAASRTGSYEIAGELVARAPVLGRGLGTLLPSYRIFDNQLLLLLVEIGVVGLLAFLGLVVTAWVVALRERRRSVDPIARDLATAVMASLAAGLVGLALFDAFSFPMAAGTLFLVLGIAGAVGRIGAVGRLPE